MLRLTMKNLVANRVRFAMTTFAVVLAVSFVVSSFVLTDGLRATFGDLSEEIVAGTDLEIRRGPPPSPRLSDADLAAAAQVEGVADAVPVVEADENTILPINAAGDAVPLNGPPQLAFSWTDNDTISAFTLVTGEVPDSEGEFSMDLDAADRHGFAVGQTYDVVTPTGLASLTLTGTTSFGENNDTLGAVLMQFPSDSLQNLLGRGGYDTIQVELAVGADSSTVQQALLETVGTEVVDNATLESEQKAEFNENIDIIGNVLLGFAGVSLFVSVFIIYNTFSIVLSQRTRELALLRTIGADPDQLRRAVQGEAVVIGVLASAIGIAAGVGVAFGLKAVFGAIGATLPDSPTIISTRTVVVALLVGVVATFVSAVGPARKASRVPAIAALRDGAEASVTNNAKRVTIGSALSLGGCIAGAIGLFAGASTATTIMFLAVGAIGVFVGVTILSPLIVGPVTLVLAWPMRRFAGVAGQLAQENAGRNARRTATTAAALMIGLALVTMALTVGESVKAQLRATLDSSVKADYLITDEAENGFPRSISDQVQSSPATEDFVAWRYGGVVVDGHASDAVSGDHESIANLFDLGITAGVAAAPDVHHPLLVSADAAAAQGLSVGDIVTAEFPNGARRDMAIIGVFTDEVIIEENYVFDDSTWAEVGANAWVDWLALSTNPDLSEAEVQAAFAQLSRDYPLANIDTFGEFVDGLEALIDQALTAMNVMVALAVIIALIGIANTLALSVFERTRELGLLRAVGMTRRQLRRMIRFEAGLVALFGAVLGVSIGIGFGWAAVAALPASVTSTLAIPVSRIVLLVVVAGTAGLIAAWAPARRAGKLNVLDAISS